MANKFNFDRVVKNMDRVKRTLPPVLANQAKNEFVDSFAQQGFEGRPWKPVQRTGKKGSQRNNSAILVQSGRLRRAVANSVKQISWEHINLSIDPGEVPYAAVHNEGLRAGRGAGFMMPKRKFMGDSEQLRVKQRSKIAEYIDKIWRG
jgi:phage gpG-like protein